MHGICRFGTQGGYSMIRDASFSPSNSCPPASFHRDRQKASSFVKTEKLADAMPSSIRTKSAVLPIFQCSAMPGRILPFLIVLVVSITYCGFEALRKIFNWISCSFSLIRITSFSSSNSSPRAPLHQHFREVVPPFPRAAIVNNNEHTTGIYGRYVDQGPRAVRRTPTQGASFSSSNSSPRAPLHQHHRENSFQSALPLRDDNERISPHVGFVDLGQRAQRR